MRAFARGTSVKKCRALALRVHKRKINGGLARLFGEIKRQERQPPIARRQRRVEVGLFSADALIGFIPIASTLARRTKRSLDGSRAGSLRRVMFRPASRRPLIGRRPMIFAISHGAHHTGGDHPVDKFPTVCTVTANCAGYCERYKVNRFTEFWLSEKNFDTVVAK